MAMAGPLEVSLLDGGFMRTKEGQLFPGARLEFRFAGPDKKFHRNILVELVEVKSGKKLASWKTFLSLKPGRKLERRYGRESLGRWSRLDEAPELAMRVLVSGSSSPLLPLPSLEQQFGALPVEKAEIAFFKVIDGDTLQLADGQRIRLIGIDCPEMAAEDPARTELGPEASAFAAEETGKGPIKLGYEGRQRDAYGRILAYVFLPDGRMLNRELLAQGLARVDERHEFSLMKEFLDTQNDARKAHKGIWESRN